MNNLVNIEPSNAKMILDTLVTKICRIRIKYAIKMVIYLNN